MVGKVTRRHSKGDVVEVEFRRSKGFAVVEIEPESQNKDPDG